MDPVIWGGIVLLTIGGVGLLVERFSSWGKVIAVLGAVALTLEWLWRK